MLKSVFRLRLIQLSRQIKALGYLYSAFFLLLYLILLRFEYWHLSRGAGGWIFTATAVILLLSLHMKRMDHRLLRLLSPGAWLVIFAEYLALLLVFLFPMLITGNTLWFMAAFPPLLILSGWQPKANTGTLFPRLPFIHHEAFEIKAGFRKQYPLVIVLVAAGLLLSWLPVVPIVTAWLLCSTMGSWYTTCESREIISSQNLQVHQFLQRKLSISLGHFIVVTLPGILVNMWIHPAQAAIIGGLYLITCLVMSTLVLSKYALYSQGSVSSAHHVINALCLISIPLPFMLPVPLVMLIRNYNKGKKKLQDLLYDPHY